MLAIVAPGQGAQTPGFLSAWLEDSSAKELLQSWSDLAGLDLIRLGTTADADEIRETSFAQPLLVAAGLLSYRALGNPASNLIAGHSVGEITAAGISGVLSHSDAMKLVSIRGKAMSAAATGTNTGMAACLGGDREVVVAHLASLGLTPANENGGGQIVAAGDLASLAKLEQNPPAGSRVRPLVVAGAFHTKTMENAQRQLAQLAKETLQNKLNLIQQNYINQYSALNALLFQLNSTSNALGAQLVALTNSQAKQ